GPIVVPDITIPGIPLSLNALGGVGPITVPGVPISRIPLTINIRIPVNITLNELPEPPRHVRRLQFLERMGSCQVVHRGG
ncbi:hypothetical protein LAN17_24845, partial [Mycobacterium tuberculosis]|nr:hypothetical protein [Mycobacterium tuberculosis]MBX4384400.1 hypothetical protein [Mycobacterium tuberculosis]MBZ4288918.1 hypothetical protein [Mycobacterium tuberculosis]MBZ4312798.1 hypothetical protein [Mycobacterium tuberculosis]